MIRRGAFRDNARPQRRDAACRRGFVIQEVRESLPSFSKPELPHQHWLYGDAYSVPIAWVQLCSDVYSWASTYRHEPVQDSVYSISSSQPFIIIWVSCTYLSPVSRLNNLPIPISFSLLTAHTLPFILRVPEGVKTQCYKKTIVMAFCQQWATARPTIGLILCSLSHLEASPWRSYGRSLDHQWAQLKWLDCKKKKKDCVQPSVL